MSAPQPALPEGWAATWSPQYNAWFYYHAATNTSQWNLPAAPGYSTAPPPQYAPQLDQQQYLTPPQVGPPPPQGGLMSKFQSMDPKAQTALGVGGGVLAGALLEHEVDEFKHHHHHMPSMGSMAGLLGAAGAGALGAKLLGGGRGQPQAPGGALGGLFSGGAPPPQPGYAAQPAGYGPPPVYGIAPPPPPPGGKPNLLAGAAMGGLAGAAGAAAMGGLGNMMHRYHGRAVSPGPAGDRAEYRAAASGLLPYTGPPLYIHAACFADRDVTDQVRGMINAQQQVVIKMSEAKEILGDPWPEVPRKGLAVLYQYGDRPMEMAVGETNEGILQIAHGPLSKIAMSFINTDANSRIVSLVWGKESVLTDARIATLETDGEMEATSKQLRDGGFWGWEPRVLQAFYYNETGSIALALARENGTLRLPWNPLSKWS